MVKINTQPPAGPTDARSEMNGLRAELDTCKCPRWRASEIESRLMYLRGWLHGWGLQEGDNLTEPGIAGQDK